MIKFNSFLNKEANGIESTIGALTQELKDATEVNKIELSNKHSNLSNGTWTDGWASSRPFTKAAIGTAGTLAIGYGIYKLIENTRSEDKKR